MSRLKSHSPLKLSQNKDIIDLLKEKGETHLTENTGSDWNHVSPKMFGVNILNNSDFLIQVTPNSRRRVNYEIQLASPWHHGKVIMTTKKIKNIASINQQGTRNYD